MDKGQLQVKLMAYSQAQTLLERSPVTIKKYQRDIRAFIEFLPDDEEIQKHHVLAYKDSLCQGQYKTSSINNFITIVNTFLKWCELSDH
ncbi:MAG: site-specific integrase, partial [Erysipelothrix sp.]|nr:site-specific integrase [Erysipelothrix sp.]